MRDLVEAGHLRRGCAPGVPDANPAPEGPGQLRSRRLAALPDDPEFRSALMGYAEWGTRLAVHNSGDAADVVERAPVPRWGWGEAPPYQPG